jgi:ribonuclease P protein component
VALPNAHRLRHRQDFSAVYQLGIKRTAPHLILRALAPASPEADAAGSTRSLTQAPTQIGISIGRKVSKLAVVRNRIKRQLRAALRHVLPKLSPGWQLVIIVKPGATQCDYEDFLRELEQLLMNAEVFHGDSGRGLL